jgi:hypothetical protein
MIFSRQLSTTPKLYRERFRADDVPQISVAGLRDKALHSTQQKHAR